jgi:hypothetical protein
MTTLLAVLNLIGSDLFLFSDYHHIHPPKHPVVTIPNTFTHIGSNQPPIVTGTPIITLSR